MQDAKDSYFISLDIWDLPVFKRLPSISVLCFISCYFSRRISQGDPKDALCLRQNILHSVLALLNLKESSPLNEQLVAAVPAAAYALCVGCPPLIIETQGILPLYIFEVMEEGAKEEYPLEKQCVSFDCSVDILAKFENDNCLKIKLTQNHKQIRLPLQLRDQLLDEMENWLLGCMKDKQIELMLISEVINMCALISNFMYWSYSTRSIFPFC